MDSMAVRKSPPYTAPLPAMIAPKGKPLTLSLQQVAQHSRGKVWLGQPIEFRSVEATRTVTKASRTGVAGGARRPQSGRMSVGVETHGQHRLLLHENLPNQRCSQCSVGVARPTCPGGQEARHAVRRAGEHRNAGRKTTLSRRRRGNMADSLS